MTSKCVLCNEHVSSGDALLVLRGTLKGNGEFEAAEAEGPACVSHLGEIEQLKEKLEGEGRIINDAKFPVTFQL